MNDKVVFLKVNNDKIQPDGKTMMACTWCRNKTFTLVHEDEGFPMLKCAACGDNMGKIGWTDTGEK